MKIQKGGTLMKQYLDGAMWIVNTLYCVGVIPQIALNYRLKTVKGLSDIMIFGYTAGYIAQILYVIAYHLPLSYKVMVPLTTVGIGIILAQRCYYDGLPSSFFKLLYIALLVASVVSCAVFFFFPQLVGWACGWFSTIVWAVTPIPQAFKMYKEHSTKGFSFPFATIMAVGICVEMISAFMLRLPIQTIFTTARGLIGYCVFAVQFFLYRKP